MGQIRVFRFDASGCNGCDIEILSTVLNQEYGIAGLDLKVVESPESANAMLVTGGGNEKTTPLLKDAYEKLQAPKLVIAMGACANSMCVFKDGYPMKGPVDTVIPVNYFVIGCPPRPQNLAIAIKAALSVEGNHTGQLWIGPEGLRARISHDSEKCTACGACANMCPSGAIEIVEDGDRFRIVYNLWKCSFCGTCQSVCPEEAVKLTSDYELWGADKNSLVETGQMERARCSVCGEFMHTTAQIAAVKARILESGDMTSFVEHVDSSLAVCEKCKHTVKRSRLSFGRMSDWVYEF